MTAAVLVGLSINALVASGPRQEEAPGLAKQFRSIDAGYQAATRSFVAEAKGLKEADVRTALRLFGLVLTAAQDARSGVDDLKVVDETRRPTDRLSKALQVQELALEQAIESTRNRDQAGATAASQQFQTAVLAYQIARQAMAEGLSRCGARCR